MFSLFSASRVGASGSPAHHWQIANFMCFGVGRAKKPPLRNGLSHCGQEPLNFGLAFFQKLAAVLAPRRLKPSRSLIRMWVIPPSRPVPGMVPGCTRSPSSHSRSLLSGRAPPPRWSPSRSVLSGSCPPIASRSSRRCRAVGPGDSAVSMGSSLESFCLK